MNIKKIIETEEITGNVVENQMPDYSNMSAEDIADKIREDRKSLVLDNALTAKQRPGFKRRIVNDKPGRIAEFIRKGWAPVKGKDEFFSDGRIQGGSQLGDVSRKIVNPSNGGQLGHYGILMEIPEVIYQEDQKRKALEQLEQEKRFNPSVVDSKEAQRLQSDTYGGVEIKRD
jgi:hypothetical protein